MAADTQTPAGAPTVPELYEALKAGDASVVKHWLNAGGSVEERMPVKLNAWNDTPIQIASAWGHPEIVRMCLDAGADVHALNYSDFNALILAATNNRIEIVKMLLAAGADPKYESTLNRRTALDMAVIRQHKEMIEFLKPLTPEDIGEPQYHKERLAAREKTKAEAAAAAAQVAIPA